MPPRTTSAAPHNDLTRRRFLLAGAAAGLLTACSGSGTDGASPPSATPKSDWSFTDDRGVAVTLPKPPERIVAYIGTAAVLWDFGVRPIGVFGPQRQDDGKPEPAAGRVDLEAVKSAGEDFEGVNLELLTALKPDLVVTALVAKDTFQVIPEEQLGEIGRIAKLVAVQAYGKPATEIITGHERLAAALGADPQSAAVQQARTELTTASEALRTAIRDKPGILAIFTNAVTEGLFVAKAGDFPDLLEYQRLGLDIVKAGGEDGYFELLSWENANKYKADLILHDERSNSLQPDELAADYPTWGKLPAVKAGQVRRWNAEPVFSYQGFRAAVTQLAEDIRGARADVV
ncbi:MAG: ABC transporter substrate-binding protein [Pseudonocardiaceae bacterium]